MSLFDFNDAGSSAPGRRCADACTVFAEARRSMALCGLGSPDFQPDGTIQRFDLPDKSRGNKAGWIVAWADGVPVVVFGSWVTGETWQMTGIDDTFQGVQGVRLVTAEEVEASRKRLEAIRAARAAEALEADRKACEWSAERLAKAGPVPPDHPYVARKRILPDLGGVRMERDGTILLPLWGVSGGKPFRGGVQRIYPDGSKKFAKGLSVKGRFGWIDGSGSEILVCEGWATGCSLHMATGQPVCIAMNAGNLLAAAKACLELNPGRRLCFCGDDDRWTEGNPGRAKAAKAAQELGARTAFPEFRSLDGNPTDFNDLHVREGLEAARLAAAPSDGVPRIGAWGVDVFSGSAPEQRWLVEGTVPMGAPTLLAAAGGTGKGMQLLDLCLKTAGGEEAGRIDFNAGAPSGWLGMPVRSFGSAVYVTAEDSKDDVHRRLQSLDPDGSRRKACRGRLFIVPLPDAGGPFPLVRATEGYRQGFETTPQFEGLLRQLRAMEGLSLVAIDPLAAFVAADVNADPQAGQFVGGTLQRLATSCGGPAVVLAHHMGKSRRQGKGEIVSAEDARDLIRGTTAIVDSMRNAVAIWPAGAVARQVIRRTEADASSDACVCCAVVKSNAPADTAVRFALRQASGAFRIVEDPGRERSVTAVQALDMLCAAIQDRAKHGAPFTRSGQAGVYMRRAELPEPLCRWPRLRLTEALEDLVRSGAVVKCGEGRSSAKWLDVPGGYVASGGWFREMKAMRETAPNVVEPVRRDALQGGVPVRSRPYGNAHLPQKAQ